ncbi:hypothetical protein Q5O24_11105 [Eubacteriaceae bacterium ES3]|nr:hypothetical protein Q5O24_11105 [Eubacteriaceae bacterium ES3]
MKQNLTFILFVVLILALTGCSQSDQSESTEESLPNPMTEISSLEAINESLGFTFDSLPEPSSDSSYYLIADTIAQVDLTFEGISFTIRKAKRSDEDISGVYTQFDHGETITDSRGNAVFYQYNDGAEGLATFSTTDYDYSVFTSDGFDLNVIQAAVNSLS